jgi:cation diffusion facilitator CzcD-associated flavoprotein CzcO
MPKRTYPKGTPTFPTRDQVADYFDGHGRAEGIEVRTNTEVERIDARPVGWPPTNTPRYIPVWPGAPGFTGNLLHSSAYLGKQSRRVARDIANELA